MNLCNEIARCQIIQRKGLCLNLVIKVRVELIFYCYEVLLKIFCSNVFWFNAPFHFRTFQYFTNAAEFRKALKYYCVKGVIKMCFFSDPYFPVFGLNTKIYSVNFYIQSEYGKIRTRILMLFMQCMGKLPAK